MKEDIVIVGTGTTGKTIFDYITAYSLYNVVGFAVNRRYKNADTFCGKPVYELESLEEKIDKSKVLLFVAMMWNRLNADRKELFLELKERGFQFGNVISPRSIVNGKINGTNIWIADNIQIEFNVTIEDNVFMNGGAVVGTNTVVGPHSFIGLNATVAGAVKIGQQSFIGIASVIFDRIEIGEKCIVGAATVVRRDLPPYSSVTLKKDSYNIRQFTEEEIENKLLSNFPTENKGH